MCGPLVNVNHFLIEGEKCLTRLAQWPPVCSSSHWQAMNVGTLMLCTNVTGSSGSATTGLYVELALIFSNRFAAWPWRAWLLAHVASPSWMRLYAHACPSLGPAGSAFCWRC